MKRRPGGELATRPLHFIWILDASGSMAVDGKIQALNNAIRETIPHMREAADSNPNAEVLVRAMQFSDGASWHIAAPTPVREFEWIDLDLDTHGVSDMGSALRLTAEELSASPAMERWLPPVLVLVSDGQPTDNMQAGLKQLMDQPWGNKAVRLAIAIGEDADVEVLQQFIGTPELKPLQANNPEALVRSIKLVSTATVQANSAPVENWPIGSLLEASQTVQTEASGLPCVVERFIGGGRQGEVYRASWAGEAVALKWYFPHQATEAQRSALNTLIKYGTSNDRFLWPMDMASSETAQGFGYIMPLRDPHYKSIVDLMKRRIEPKFRALITAGIELADSFLELHARGLCYQDISFDNVFFEPETGAVLICDNDNVAINGQARPSVLGTARFMAPEVVRGESMPSTETDLYSLAVLLFYLLMLHHPLEGKRETAIHCLDLGAMNSLYGEQPLFIFDPDDSGNAPIPGCHDNALAFWPIYPRFLRDLFTQAFTEGLHDPRRRVRESEWRAAFTRLRDSIVYCGCGQENFCSVDPASEPADEAGRCWSCHRELQMPPRLQIGSRAILLNFDTRLYPHHIDSDRAYDFAEPVGIVVGSPGPLGRWELKNITDITWRATSSDGTVRDVEPDRSVALAQGTRIEFGSAEGVVYL